MSDTSQSRTGPSGALFALAGFTLFSFHDAIVKVLGETYTTFQIVFFSVLFAFPLATFSLAQDKTQAHLRPHFPVWTAIRTVAVMVTGLCAFYAFSELPLSQVYAVLFAMPLLITILSIPILGETVRLRRWIAVIVGLIGVIIVLRPGTAALGWGHAAAVAAALGGATASIIVRKVGAGERSMVLLLYPMMANFVAMGFVLPFVYVPMPLADLGALVAMSALAFGASLCLIAAYRRSEAVIVAPMQYAQLIWATLLGLLFFDEWPDVWTGVGAAVIISSGLYILLRESRSGASETTPVSRGRPRPDTGTYARVKTPIVSDPE